MRVTFGLRPRASDGISGYGLYALPVALVIVSLYLVPLISVLGLSVTDPNAGVDNYVRALTADGPLKVLFTTLRICVVSTLFSVITGYVLAYAATSAPRGVKVCLIAAILVPFWVSVLIRAFSWLIILRDNGVMNQTLEALHLTTEPFHIARTETAVIIGMVHYLTPYAALPLMAGMQQIDVRVIAAAKSLGASDTRTFFAIFLPMTAPGLFAAAVIVFVFSLGFFVTPALLGGGRVMMISEYVSVNVLQTIRWGFAAAEATILLLLTLAAVTVLSRTVGLERALK